jgi:hypothetical protein
MKRAVMLSVVAVAVVASVVFVLSRGGTMSGLVASSGVAVAGVDGQTDSGSGSVPGSEGAGMGIAALERAGRSDRYVFVFFHGDSNQQTEAMRLVFDGAVRGAGAGVDHVVVDVRDPAERAIVDKLNVSRAPLPLAVVIAPNGAVTGGFPGEFTEDQLAGAVVSSATEGCLAALQEGHIVLVCVQGTSTAKNDAAMNGVRALMTDARHAGSSDIVMVDPSDPRERELLDRLGVDVETVEAVTVVMVPPATAVARFSGATDEATLVKALEAAASACAPGAGSGCCPGK